MFVAQISVVFARLSPAPARPAHRLTRRRVSQVLRGRTLAPRLLAVSPHSRFAYFFLPFFTGGCRGRRRRASATLILLPGVGAVLISVRVSLVSCDN